jgi:hypothetical protein
MVESDIVLLYILCRVWGVIYAVGLSVATVRKRKVIDIAIDEVSEALSMHAVPPAIWTVVVPTRVIVLLGLHNPPCSWTGTMGPSLLASR